MVLYSATRVRTIDVSLQGQGGPLMCVHAARLAQMLPCQMYCTSGTFLRFLLFRGSDILDIAFKPEMIQICLESRSISSI